MVLTELRESVEEMLERLGGSLLTLAAGSLEAEQIVEDVVVISPGESAAVNRGSVVFGVGFDVETPASCCRLLTELGAAGAAALVLRGPIEFDSEIELAASASRVPLLALAEDEPWIHLADVIRPGRGWKEEDSVITEASLSADLNLFKVANSLAEILDAPVTIEDLRSRVLAFSDDQARADDVRKTSVLGQQVPHKLNAAMARVGVFKRLYDSDKPVRIDEQAGGVRARVAIRIRAGATLLGSIWAITEGPLSDAQVEAMVGAANTAGAAILQGRIAGDAVQRMRTATVAALIAGGQPARAAAGKAHRSRVRGGCVLAARLRTERTDETTASPVNVDRLASSLVMFLRSECTAAVAAVLNDTVYAVMLHTAESSVDVESVQRLVRSFVERRGSDLDGLIVGIGGAVCDPAELDHSREDAELVLRVLDMPAARRPSAAQVATREDVHGLSLVLRLSDIAAGDPVMFGGPLASLEEYDLEHQSDLCKTLDCWLEQFGDVARTADLMHIHRNTLRYRLGRIEELGGVDLDDPEQRFELMLQFRIRRSLGEPDRIGLWLGAGIANPGWDESQPNGAGQLSRADVSRVL
jgi:PucR C-terminal helix-turn-helix domain